MTNQEDIWECSECGQEQGRHDMWFEGICGYCNANKLTEEEKVRLDNFIALKRVELKKGIENINGAFCNISFDNCDENSITLNTSHGVSDGYSRGFINGTIELYRDTFEVSDEIYHTRVSQEYEEEEIVIKL